MQTIAPPAPGHLASGELVDDDDFAILQHVVAVALVEHVRAQRLLDVVVDFDVHRVVHVAAVQQTFHLVDALFGQRNSAVLLVNGVVAGGVFFPRLLAFDHLAAGELGDDAVDAVVLVGGLLRRTGNDQRRARFVNQDRIDFVDDREVVLALRAIGERELHVVAQEVEPELVVGAVSNVAEVARPALLIVQAVDNVANG